MKNIFKTLLLLVLVTTVSSCSRDQGDTDYLDNRENIISYTASSGTLFIEEGEANEYVITVSATSIAKTDANFTIEVDETSRAVLDEDFTISSNTSIAEGNLVTSFTVSGIYENSTLEGETVRLNLVGADGVSVGNNNQFELELIRSCPFTGLNTTSYDATVYTSVISTDDGVGPPFSLTLEPVLGVENTWSLSSAWGPNYVAWTQGNNPAFNNQYVYPATIKIEDDFSVTVTGLSNDGPGGSGIFNPCTQEMLITLNQSVFSNPFTVDVTFVPN